MKEKQLSVPITVDQLLKLNIYCKVNDVKQKEVVSKWIDALPDYVSKTED